MPTPSSTHHQLRDISTIIVADSRRVAPTGGSNNSTNYASPFNYASIENLDAALVAANAIFTPARLLQMSINDKVFALRLHGGGTPGF